MKKYSKQREEIITVLKTNRNHPTAEEIYQILKANSSTASRSTVYRNLKELVAEKIIWKISINNSPSRYDYPLKNHNHLICYKCEAVKDFEYDFQKKEIRHDIKKQLGIDPEIKTVIIYDICSECKNKLKN